MTPIVRAGGAPIEQGRAQGAALGEVIRAEVTRLRASLPWLARRAIQRRVGGASARALETQLPWQRERIEGMAHAARSRESLLLLAEAQTRVAGAAFFGGALLSAVFDLPWELESLVILRHSAPDAGGFASVELALATTAGCLCGVNSEGIAVIAIRDLSRDELSLRFHAQELLFRARDLDAGIDHLRRRAAYAGGTGTLVASDAHGGARVLEFAAGKLEVGDASVLPRAALAPRVELDPKLCRLRLFSLDGAQEISALDAH
jgi:hypothetical protein